MACACACYGHFDCLAADGAACGGCGPVQGHGVSSSVCSSCAYLSFQVSVRVERHADCCNCFSISLKCCLAEEISALDCSRLHIAVLSAYAKMLNCTGRQGLTADNEVVCAALQGLLFAPGPRKQLPLSVLAACAAFACKTCCLLCEDKLIGGPPPVTLLQVAPYLPPLASCLLQRLPHSTNALPHRPACPAAACAERHSDG